MDSNMICHLDFQENYELCISLHNGQKIYYDLKPKLHTMRFADILDKELYKQGRLLKSKIIRWNGNTEITVDEILADIEKREEYVKKKRRTLE